MMNAAIALLVKTKTPAALDRVGGFLRQSLDGLSEKGLSVGPDL